MRHGAGRKRWRGRTPLARFVAAKIGRRRRCESIGAHSGGANAVFADGSVHFLRANSDICVFARLATRAGGEAQADAIVTRVLRDQKPDGSWQLHQPSWDVHAGFDAVFTLKQLGRDRVDCRQAIGKAATWALQCRNADGGFGHFPGYASDIDAIYFHPAPWSWQVS